MSHQNLKADIEKILQDDKMSRDEQVKLLDTMRETVRAEMRAATESAMVDDNEVGDDLKLLDEALEGLSAHPDLVDGKGAATL